MHWNWLVRVCVPGLALLGPGLSRADDSAATGPRDPGAEVLAVFSVKCAGCHGAHLPKPRGGFGYILDLRRVAGNPDMVIPGKPDESELLTLLVNSEMPPPDAPAGPLTDKQKAVVRAWIAAGAPAASSPPPSPSTAVVFPPTPLLDDDGNGPAVRPIVPRLLRQLGKLHLMLLHFPIALLIAAAVGELWSVWKRSSEPAGTVRFCLCLGAAAAVPTVALGWLFALGGYGVGSPGLLFLHRWLGTAAGVGAVAAALVSEWDARRGAPRWRVRILLVLAVLLVGLTAHFGGLLVHGKDFFD